MNRWIMLGLFGVMLATTGAAHWLREPWKRGFRSNVCTIPGDARGRQIQPFGYVEIPRVTRYAPGHATDSASEHP